jgi:predicted metal-binding membrane protein
VGVAAFALTRPHSTLVAGVVVIAAGCYELTPVKRHFRRRCLENADSGLGFGLCCLGSTIGLMAILVALGVMSLFWMAVIALIATAQKLMPENALIDTSLALAIIGFGLVII